GTGGPAFIFRCVIALENPLQAKRVESLLRIAKLLRVTPGPPRVVKVDAPAVFGRDLAERHSDRRMKAALDVDALAGRKCGVEVGGILELELGSTHSMLPSSALSESGYRGRSLVDPLSPKLPRFLLSRRLMVSGRSPAPTR